jgi:hypothetical protein
MVTQSAGLMRSLVGRQTYVGGPDRPAVQDGGDPDICRRVTYASRVRRLDLLWWTFFGVGAAAWTAVLIRVYSGWNPPPLLFAGLATYGLTLALTHHGLRIRRFRGQRTP